MKVIATLTIVAILFSCSKSKSDNAGTNNLLIEKKWKAYEYYHNDKYDAFVIGQQPTFEFKNDHKVYFSQINPISKDTFQFEFLNDLNIKLTKPSISTSAWLNILISRLDSTHFDFSISNNEDSDIDKYKTMKQ